MKIIILFNALLTYLTYELSKHMITAADDMRVTINIINIIN